MDNDVQQLIEKLKHGAIDRCRERALRAAEKSSTTIKKAEYTPSTRGITSHLRREYGLQ